MVDAFGSQVDTTPNKHIGVEAGTGTLDADVVPCFEMHRYDGPRRYVVGHRIYPKNGGWVDNYPQQNYDNSVEKNRATGRRYKEIVRCTKRLALELYEGKKIPRDYPGYLIESLIYNVPNDRFGHVRRYDDMQSVLRFAWKAARTLEPAAHFPRQSEMNFSFSSPTRPTSPQGPADRGR